MNELIEYLRMIVIETGNKIKDNLGIKGKRTVFSIEPGENDEPTLVEKTIDMDDTGMKDFAIDNGEGLPNITFDGRLCLISIGQWLGMLKSVKVRGMGGISVHSHLDANELDRNTIVLNTELKEVSKEFAKLLLQAGIPATETLVLSEFNEDRGSFKCHLVNANKDINMSYSYGDFIDNGPELVLQEGENNTTYYFGRAYEDKPNYLSLEHYTRVNPETGVKYWYYNSEYFFSCTLTDGEHHLSIHMYYPESLEDISKNPYVDVEKVKEKLMAIRLPHQVDEMFKLMHSCLLCDYKDFEKIDIKEEKVTKTEENGREKEVSVPTNVIVLNGKELKKFVITKEGKTIIINGENDWVNKGEHTVIAQSSQGYVAYNAISILSSELALLNPEEEYKNAKKEVEDVVRLTMSLLPQDNMM